MYTDKIQWILPDPVGQWDCELENSTEDATLARRKPW